MVRFERARIEDAETLTEVQKRTFNDDAVRFGGQPAVGPVLPVSSGPPGYDSVDWTLWAIKTGIYFKILAGDRIIGGVILFDMHKRHFNLGRIFVDPDWQNQGIGSQAVRFVEKTFRYVKRWSLDTPGWAVRNHHFYEKLGYVKVGEEVPEEADIRLYLYEKRMP
ncbi:MAG: GNAT family N-acetyltransferase [Anaerolineae bacterium]|nr:GNAT family N-acetyltransferase [Anaerolineae bacterium]